jgi:cob(I)alamin adenosyltransferase
MKKGYLQIYTGNGKGKTTAALGLTLRAAGAGLKVFIAQFIKSGDYSEIKALKRFSDLVVINQYGLGRFIKGKPSQEDIDAATVGIQEARSAMVSGKYDVIIMEEANVALSCGLFSLERLLEIIKDRPESVELVITGRGADSQIIENADLVTEMREIKHYYNKGVGARIGIEK